MIIDHEQSWIHHIAVHFEKAMRKGHPLWISKINIFNTILQKKFNFRGYSPIHINKIK